MYSTVTGEGEWTAVAGRGVLVPRNLRQTVRFSDVDRAARGAEGTAASSRSARTQCSRSRWPRRSSPRRRARRARRGAAGAAGAAGAWAPPSSARSAATTAISRASCSRSASCTSAGRPWTGPRSSSWAARAAPTAARVARAHEAAAATHPLPTIRVPARAVLARRAEGRRCRRHSRRTAARRPTWRPRGSRRLITRCSAPRSRWPSARAAAHRPAVARRAPVARGPTVFGAVILPGTALRRAGADGGAPRRRWAVWTSWRWKRARDPERALPCRSSSPWAPPTRAAGARSRSTRAPRTRRPSAAWTRHARGTLAPEPAASAADRAAWRGSACVAAGGRQGDRAGRDLRAPRGGAQLRRRGSRGCGGRGVAGTSCSPSRAPGWPARPRLRSGSRSTRRCSTRRCMRSRSRAARRAAGRIVLPFAWRGASLRTVEASALRVRLAPAGAEHTVSLDVADGAGTPVAHVEALAVRPADAAQVRGARSAHEGALLRVDWLELPGGGTAAAGLHRRHARAAGALGDPRPRRWRLGPRPGDVVGVQLERYLISPRCALPSTEAPSRPTRSWRRSRPAPRDAVTAAADAAADVHAAAVGALALLQAYLADERLAPARLVDADARRGRRSGRRGRAGSGGRRAVGTGPVRAERAPRTARSCWSTPTTATPRARCGSRGRAPRSRSWRCAAGRACAPRLAPARSRATRSCPGRRRRGGSCSRCGARSSGWRWWSTRRGSRRSARARCAPRVHAAGINFRDVMIVLAGVGPPRRSWASSATMAPAWCSRSGRVCPVSSPVIAVMGLFAPGSPRSRSPITACSRRSPPDGRSARRRRSRPCS